MLLLPFALASGVIFGRLAGGSVASLRALRIRATALLLAALAIQLSLFAVAAPVRWMVVDVSYSLVGVWLLINLRFRHRALRVAMALVAIGWFCNLAPIVANGGMPISLDAARRAGAPRRVEVNANNVAKHVAAGPSTRLRALGDVIPLRAFRAVISVGDILLAAGIIVTIGVGMKVRDESSALCAAGP